MITFREPPREVKSLFLPLTSLLSAFLGETDSLMGTNTCSFPFSAQHALTARIAKVSRSLPGFPPSQDPRLSPPSLSSLRFLLL